MEIKMKMKQLRVDEMFGNGKFTKEDMENVKFDPVDFNDGRSDYTITEREDMENGE